MKSTQGPSLRYKRRMKHVEVLPYQAAFIEFLVDSQALLLGQFTTKSGRQTPYFVNTGKFNDGAKLERLGGFYAAHIVQHGLSSAQVIFGPAYKGIPLSVATVIALAREHQLVRGFCFDRKEAKDHGDCGLLVGQAIERGTEVVLVEDVVTAGTTLRKMVPFLRENLGAKLRGVVICVDRCERGEGALSAVQEARQELGIEVYPIATIHHILQHLRSHKNQRYLLGAEQCKAIETYLEQYGAA